MFIFMKENAYYNLLRLFLIMKVKSLISLFRPIPKKSFAKRSYIRPNVGIQSSFKSARSKEVAKSYPLEKPPFGVHYLPILETGPQHDVRGHDVHLGKYNPFEPGLHVSQSHSQLQPRLLRTEAPTRHVEPYHPRSIEPYHPEQAHEAYFPEGSFRHPPESYAR